MYFSDEILHRATNISVPFVSPIIVHSCRLSTPTQPSVGLLPVTKNALHSASKISAAADGTSVRLELINVQGHP